MLERSFFEHVLDAFEGFVGDEHGVIHARTHRRGVKVWFDGGDGVAAKEHYEAQLIRHGGDVALEIGFHAEHADPAHNDDVLTRLTANEADWRAGLGREAEAGVFLGMDGWRRVSETWEPPDPDDPEASIEIAARLADYARALEPVRVTTS